MKNYKSCSFCNIYIIITCQCLARRKENRLTEIKCHYSTPVLPSITNFLKGSSLTKVKTLFASNSRCCIISSASPLVVYPDISYLINPTAAKLLTASSNAADVLTLIVAAFPEKLYLQKVLT